MAQRNDCQLAYFQLNGATSNNLNDAAYEYLAAQIPAFTDGHLNDMWFEVLRGQLYKGDLTEMKDQFWIDNGCGQ